MPSNSVPRLSVSPGCQQSRSGLSAEAGHSGDSSAVSTVITLGEVMHIGDLIASSGACEPGQGPRVKKNPIFPTAVLQDPIDVANKSECTFIIGKLKPNSAISLGVSNMGVHSLTAEDWAGKGKTGHVWFVILRAGGEGRPLGGGSFMDGSRVISSSSALFANPGTRVTLKWHKDVMQVEINGDLVGSIRTDSTPAATREHVGHHLRFGAQFWNARDQLVLKSSSGLLVGSCVSTPKGGLGNPVGDDITMPVKHLGKANTPRKGALFLGKGAAAKAEEEKAAVAAAVAAAAAAQQAQHLGSSAGAAEDDTTPFTWACCFTCVFFMFCVMWK